MTNTANRVVSYITWDSNTTTWNTETRTWNEMGTNMSNTTLQTDSLWSSRSFPWQMLLPWQQIGGMTNTSKPI